MSEELKPCPFCEGNTPETFHDTDGWIVQCTSCETEMFAVKTEKEAIKWWNFRPVEDALKVEIANLRIQVETLTVHMALGPLTVNMARSIAGFADLPSALDVFVTNSDSMPKPEPLKRDGFTWCGKEEESQDEYPCEFCNGSGWGDESTVCDVCGGSGHRSDICCDYHAEVFGRLFEGDEDA